MKPQQEPTHSVPHEAWNSGVEGGNGGDGGDNGGDGGDGGDNGGDGGDGGCASSDWTQCNDPYTVSFVVESTMSARHSDVNVRLWMTNVGGPKYACIKSSSKAK